MRYIAAPPKAFASYLAENGKPQGGGSLGRGVRICLTFSNPERWEYFLISLMERRLKSKIQLSSCKNLTAWLRCRERVLCPRAYCSPSPDGRRSWCLCGAFLFLKEKLFIFVALVFAASHGLDLVAESWGFSTWRHVDFSDCNTQTQQSWLMGPKVYELQPVVHRLSCSTARGIFWDQGSNPCPLH